MIRTGGLSNVVLLWAVNTSIFVLCLSAVAGVRGVAGGVCRGRVGLFEGLLGERILPPCQRPPLRCCGVGRRIPIHRRAPATSIEVLRGRRMWPHLLIVSAVFVWRACVKLL
eukprot:COSAG01_NODE_1706_length_9427_cov_51.196934_7_plen_112_part_00